MNMLECFGGGIDWKHYNQSMQHNLDMSFGLSKTYHLILGNVCGENGVWQKVDDYSHCLSLFHPENRTILFINCANFSHILPKDLVYLYVCENNWVCLCDALSYNTSSSLRRIEICYCNQLESLFCLSNSCYFCTKIHNLDIIELTSLESLTFICEDVVDVGQSLSSSGIFFCLKKISICNCHLIEKLLTPQLVQQLQNLETITVSSCNSMKEIFAVSNTDDSSIITIPKLTKLDLYNLPELKIVCKGRIRCRSSLKVTINCCPNLEKHPTIEIRDV
jgi:hypothetical protein